MVKKINEIERAVPEKGIKVENTTTFGLKFVEIRLDRIFQKISDEVQNLEFEPKVIGISTLPPFSRSASSILMIILATLSQNFREFHFPIFQILKSR